MAYPSSDNERSTSSSLTETSGQVLFQRHRPKTKFQYASSLEQLGLARLSSTESREAAVAMGIEEVGDQETPVCIGFTVTKEGRGDLRLEGAADTALIVPCARCACSVGVPIEGPFNLLLTAKPLRVVGRTVVGIVRGRKDQELEDLEEAEAMAGALDDEAYDLDLDDKKYFPPEAAEIDLSEYIRQTILLKVPIRVLCKEDCKGLCIDCGADWNKQSCSCAQKKKLNNTGAPKTNWGSDLAQLRDRLRKES
ncbi:hypothetical protein KFL_003560090 [Klebsormidium nitens]|uniref:DUF177 domain-containing protein n=1 Tax=Klebsormidium nitens TaxID=105231 RepID=A0A1Y1IBY8_KLENI|nr:hypothetical protein KFL_003560090 [Klebsormidium nitens]|eukprot:GAQ87482.1 hypothetical protein KFL_003560090 [Klebsormidium nitens]